MTRMVTKQAEMPERRSINALKKTSSDGVGARNRAGGRATGKLDLADYVPKEVGIVGDDHQTALPRIARDPKLSRLIDQALRRVPTSHELGMAVAGSLAQGPGHSKWDRWSKRS